MIDTKLMEDKHQVTVVNPQTCRPVDDIEKYMKANKRGLRRS